MMVGLSKVASMLCLALVPLALAGCMTTSSGYFTPGTSVDAVSLDVHAANAVAADMVVRLSEHVGPGTGTIALKSDGTAMASAFEEQLRRSGYAIDPSASGTNAIPIAYTIDAFGGQVLARISTPSLELARTYAITEDGAQPVSPLSAMHRIPS